MITTANAMTTTLHPISDEDREDNARKMQMEALGFSRREKISTKEFKEKRLEFVPLSHIQRRIDQAGTEENRLAADSGVRSHLTAWDTAYQKLRGDGTADERLPDVNEGMGQTHRGRLQADDSVRKYNPDGDYFHGSNRGVRGGRGGRGGGRGGGFSSRGSGKIDRFAPIKRARVVKGSENIPFNSSASSKVASRATSASTIADRSPKQTASINRQTSAKRDLSTEPPRRSTAHVNELQQSELKKARVNYGGQLATPDDFMASIRARSAQEAHHVLTTSMPLTNDARETNSLIEPYVNQDNTASGASKTEVATSENAAHGIDLIELDNGYEATQQPYSTIEHPLPSDGMTEALQEFPSTNHASSKMEVDPIFDAVTTIEEAGKAELPRVKRKIFNKPRAYTVVEMMALRAKVMPSEPDDDDWPPESPSVEPEDDAHPLESPPIEEELVPVSSDTTPSTTPEESDPIRNIALERAAERHFILGEHVHRSAFQRHDLIEKANNTALANTQPQPIATSSFVEVDPVRPSSSPPRRPRDADSGAPVHKKPEQHVITRGRVSQSANNGNLRSFTATEPTVSPRPTSPSPKPHLRSKLNTTGFIGRAEARKHAR